MDLAGGLFTVLGLCVAHYAAWAFDKLMGLSVKLGFRGLGFRVSWLKAIIMFFVVVYMKCWG